MSLVNYAFLMQMRMVELELAPSFHHRSSIWGLVHCLSMNFPQNLEVGKSAIAMSISTKSADHRDFRELDRK